MRHLFLLVFLTVGCVAGQSLEAWPGPLSVETQYGRIVFKDITTGQISDLTGQLRPRIAATIENHTGTTWHVMQFEVRCPADSGSPYVLMIPTIVPGVSEFKEPYPQTDGLKCSPNLLTIKLTKSDGSDREKQEARDREARDAAALEAEQAAIRDADEKARKAEADAMAKREKAEQAKQAAERVARERARQAYLAKFSLLNSGAANFIGADRKCSEEFVQALSMDGLEKRQRLLQLITLCGFTEEHPVHVAKEQTDGAYCKVRLVDGEHPNATGWVPCSWIRAPFDEK